MRGWVGRGGGGLQVGLLLLVCGDAAGSMQQHMQAVACHGAGGNASASCRPARHAHVGQLAILARQTPAVGHTVVPSAADRSLSLAIDGRRTGPVSGADRRAACAAGQPVVQEEHEVRGLVYYRVSCTARSRCGGGGIKGMGASCLDAAAGAECDEGSWPGHTAWPVFRGASKHTGDEALELGLIRCLAQHKNPHACARMRMHMHLRTHGHGHCRVDLTTQVGWLWRRVQPAPALAAGHARRHSPALCLWGATGAGGGRRLEGARALARSHPRSLGKGWAACGRRLDWRRGASPPHGMCCRDALPPTTWCSCTSASTYYSGMGLCVGCSCWLPPPHTRTPPRTHPTHRAPSTGLTQPKPETPTSYPCGPRPCIPRPPRPEPPPPQAGYTTRAKP